ncbi:50S ribosomal protein L11 methyltransferase [Stomatohabitans albus]|uniref:50S ribosomal protein L11 methyltransferase n=1 Tax=Stomatohabitans albus TaxID=3110766 RepID=UPI00300C5B40
MSDTNTPVGGEDHPSGYWTFHSPINIDEVATALLLADIAYDALSQAATLRPGASEGREETPEETDFESQSTVVYAQDWTEDNRPNMPVPGQWVFEPERDWNEAWRRGIEPVRIGHVLIVPPWLDAQTSSQSGDIRFIIDPGQAFGTGHHETTTHCIQALVDTDLNGKRVADIGTGTGILAMVAAALGATEVMAVDIDSTAVRIARDIIADHQPRLFPNTRMMCAQGSADSIPTPPTFDVVVANMISPVLMEIANDLARLLSPNGQLIMSGISNQRAQEVENAFAQERIKLSITPGVEWALAIGHTMERNDER